MMDKHGQLFIKMKHFDLLYSDVERSGPLLSPSVAVTGWLKHMAEWTDQANTFPALVLHKPGTRIDSAVFVIYASDRNNLKEIYQSWQDDSSKNFPKSAPKALPSLTAPSAAAP
jgi:hypothetical protein